MAETSPQPPIPDDWLNDYSDYRQCFVCGQANDAGLQARYRQEGDHIVTEFVGGKEHQGFPGYVHGGLLSTLLDETMGRTALFSRTWVMTGKLEVRYRTPAPIGQKLIVRGWLTRGRRDSFESRGEVTLHDGTVLAEGRGLFIRVPDDVKDLATREHPELGGYFAAMPDGRPAGRRP